MSLGLSVWVCVCVWKWHCMSIYNGVSVRFDCLSQCPQWLFEICDSDWESECLSVCGCLYLSAFVCLLSLCQCLSLCVSLIEGGQQDFHANRFFKYLNKKSSSQVSPKLSPVSYNTDTLIMGQLIVLRVAETGDYDFTKQHKYSYKIWLQFFYNNNFIRTSRLKIVKN